MAIKIKFQVKADKNAKSAAILGDFTNWEENPIEMKKIHPGLFEVNVKLKEYRIYHYKFKIDDKWKEIMEDDLLADGTVPNPFGSRNYYIDTRNWEKRPSNLSDDLEEKETAYDSVAEQILKECIEINNFEKWDAYKKQYKRINLEGINLKGANLRSVDLSYVILSNANLMKANLYEADLEEALLLGANFRQSNLVRANMKRAQLHDTNLEKAKLNHACLINAQANYSSLNGAGIHNTYLQGADFSFSKVDGETLINTDQIDKFTNFTGVGMTSARLKPGLYETLSYNIRKFRWNEWYTKGNFIYRIIKNLFCRPFWMLSDYGRSTARILSVFIIVAFLCSVLYWFFPEIILNIDSEAPLDRMYRTFYFSVVTMITLGFGNMNANPNSFWGNSVVSFQIVFGYITLAALVTRISLLFASGGPEVGFKKIKRSIKTLRDIKGT